MPSASTGAPDAAVSEVRRLDYHTRDNDAALYLEIARKWYGHHEGVSVVDDYVAHEWSYIPHFYRDFYVYQYATSFTAALALAQAVKAGDAERRRRDTSSSSPRWHGLPDRAAP